METVTIPKTEYHKLKRYSSAYLKIAIELADAEQEFPYDYKYIDKIMRDARLENKKKRSIEAGSVDEALRKFRGK